MKRQSLLVLLLCGALFAPCQAADETTIYPITDYEEPRVGTSPDKTEWNAISSGLHATWASRSEHYSLHRVPTLTEAYTDTVWAWRGERVGVQALLYSKTSQGRMTVRMTEWTKNDKATGINGGEARFVNYVITDDYQRCGNHPTDLITWLVPDVIDIDRAHTVPAMETRPVWCTLEVPRDAAAGVYKTKLEICDFTGSVVAKLRLVICVADRTLPEVKDQKFHLDLWQQPYAVSRYYGVEQWSDEHIEALRPYLKALARAGQSTVSTIMFYEPWGQQSHDKFQPMVITTKKSNGQWAYDYTIFDRYVELCAECGIDKQISCFSMVPWDMSFRYEDEATGTQQYISATTSSTAYKELWTSFLTAFKAHLIEKGWFDKTCIAMDERSESDMLNAYSIASALDFKMALAGNYHASLADKLQDFCVAVGQEGNFSADVLAQRKANGQVTTFYTCCSTTEPNIFSNSLPAEAAWLPLHAAATGMDGYLHWSWINWTESPLTDTRFFLFGAGDTFFYYPGNRPSIRFERLIEGIQQFEKIQILREAYAGDETRSAALENVLAKFKDSTTTSEECAPLVDEMEYILNECDKGIDETAINAVAAGNDTAHKGTYDLNGRRTTADAPGIYIIDGQKQAVGF